MRTAQTIIKKKAFIKTEMDRQIGKPRSDALWSRATEKLSAILEQYSGLPKGVHTHTDNYIFPAAAIYLTVREEVGPETAYSIIERSAIDLTEHMGKKLTGLMKLPGLPDLFVKAWDPLCRKMFGASCGFRNVFYPKEKGAYRMDITACPYNRYFTELGCPELTRIYCDNDERIYGSLPGLLFERKTTLGKGGECCDFFLKRL